MILHIKYVIFLQYLGSVKLLVLRAARGFGCVSDASLTVASRLGFAGPAVGFMCCGGSEMKGGLAASPRGERSVPPAAP